MILKKSLITSCLLACLSVGCGETVDKEVHDKEVQELTQKVEAAKSQTAETEKARVAQLQKAKEESQKEISSVVAQKDSEIATSIKDKEVALQAAAEKSETDIANAKSEGLAAMNEAQELISATEQRIATVSKEEKNAARTRAELTSDIHAYTEKVAELKKINTKISKVLAANGLKGSSDWNEVTNKASILIDQLNTKISYNTSLIAKANKEQAQFEKVVGEYEKSYSDKIFWDAVTADFENKPAVFLVKVSGNINSDDLATIEKKINALPVLGKKDVSRKVDVNGTIKNKPVVKSDGTIFYTVVADFDTMTELRDSLNDAKSQTTMVTDNVKGTQNMLGYVSGAKNSKIVSSDFNVTIRPAAKISNVQPYLLVTMQNGSSKKVYLPKSSAKLSNFFDQRNVNSVVSNSRYIDAFIPKSIQKRNVVDMAFFFALVANKDFPYASKAKLVSLLKKHNEIANRPAGESNAFSDQGLTIQKISFHADFENANFDLEYPQEILVESPKSKFNYVSFHGNTATYKLPIRNVYFSATTFPNEIRRNVFMLDLLDILK